MNDRLLESDPDGLEQTNPSERIDENIGAIFYTNHLIIVNKFEKFYFAFKVGDELKVTGIDREGNYYANLTNKGLGYIQGVVVPKELLDKLVKMPVEEDKSLEMETFDANICFARQQTQARISRSLGLT